MDHSAKGQLSTALTHDVPAGGMPPMPSQGAVTTSAQPHPEQAAPTASPWHSMNVGDVVASQQASADGLSTEEVSRRQARFGSNIISAGKPDSGLIIFLRQLNSPLLYVLLGSGTLALLMGKLTDGAVVLGVVLLNAIIGFVQEYKAQKTISALGSMIPDTTTVRRNGAVVRIPAADVVPGDVVLLQSGDKVPADLRLTAIKNLQVDESALTGEAVPVYKQIQPVAADAPLGDRSSMAYGGTMVTYGTGTGLVVGTGSDTELGRISLLLRQTDSLATPLTRSIAKVSLWLTVVIVAITLILFGISLWRGYLVADAIVAAISLAVAAIPEGLPAIITIALAIGVRRMANRRVIIRSLPAVETLGSTTIICSDKTGTLTKNEMTVQAIWTSSNNLYRVSGVGYAPEGELLHGDGRPVETDRCPEEVLEIIRAGSLCNDSTVRQDDDDNGEWIVEGDPTEISLVVAGRKLGLPEDTLREEYKRVDVVPFESERQIMGTLHLRDSGRKMTGYTPGTSVGVSSSDRRNLVIYIKGAPEVVASRCVAAFDGSRLDAAAIGNAIELLASRGMRVLAMARKEVPMPLSGGMGSQRGGGNLNAGPGLGTGAGADTGYQLDEKDLESGFTFLGMQGMIDPPREEAKAAFVDCKNAGIGVRMITGDHAITAQAIGTQLGMPASSPVVTGNQLATMSDDQLKDVALSSHVFARVAPEHKLRLVSALQARGNVVAMTGDGVNDAPALKRADIGVAMGITGTAVSRQASDMVLTDDNFSSIVAAVEEGRRVFDNLVKSFMFVLPTNIGEALVIMAAVMFFPIIAGQPVMPILPVQILWLNLVATIALALPLAFEAKESNLMKRPPRQPSKPILDLTVIVRTVYVAVLMAAGALGLFLHEYNVFTAGGMGEQEAMAQAQTAAVTSIVFFQVFYLLTCRSLKGTMFSVGVFSNPKVFIGIAGIILLQLGFVYLPFMQSLFNSADMGVVSWLRAILSGAVVLPVVAIEKWLRGVVESKKQPAFTSTAIQQ